jgi:hypothetical protein
VAHGLDLDEATTRGLDLLDEAVACGLRGCSRGVTSKEEGAGVVGGEQEPAAPP